MADEVKIVGFPEGTGRRITHPAGPAGPSIVETPGSGGFTGTPASVCLPPLPDITPQLEAWKTRQPKCQKNPEVMSPMEEITWFNTPVSNVYTLFTPTPSSKQVGTVVLLPNPQRVGVIFSWISNDVYLTNNPEIDIAQANFTFDVTTGTGSILEHMATVLNFAPLISSPLQLNPSASVGAIGSLIGVTSGGIMVDIRNPTISFLQKDYGSLPSQGWIASIGYQEAKFNQGGKVSVVEIVLRDWPHCEK